MTLALVTLSLALLGALGALTWSIHRVSQLGDQRIEAERAVATQLVRADRAEIERNQAISTLAAEQTRSRELEAALADSLTTEARNANADLPADDVAARLQRRRAARAAATGAGDPLPTQRAPTVPG